MKIAKKQTTTTRRTQRGFYVVSSCRRGSLLGHLNLPRFVNPRRSVESAFLRVLFVNIRPRLLRPPSQNPQEDLTLVFSAFRQLPVGVLTHFAGPISQN